MAVKKASLQSATKKPVTRAVKKPSVKKVPKDASKAKPRARKPAVTKNKPRYESATTSKPVPAVQPALNAKRSATKLPAPHTLFLTASRMLANPLPLMPVMQNTARYSGVFFVVFGAFYALYFAQFLYTDSTVVAQQASVQTPASEIVTSSNLAAQVINTSPVLSTTNTRPPVDFVFEPVKTLKDTVRIRITVAEATSVTLSAFYESYQNNIPLGPARKLGPNEWEYIWDTTQFQDGNYRVVADVTNEYVGDRAYRSSHYSYLLLSNAEPLPEAEVDDVEIVPMTDSTDSATTEVTDAEAGDNTASATNSPTAPTTATPALVPVTETSIDGAESNSNVLDTEVRGRIMLPTLSPAQGTIPVRVLTSPAETVEIYIQNRSDQTFTRRFVGIATPRSRTEWILQYDTTQTPNGTYRLLAVVKGTTGTFETPPVAFTVENPIVRIERNQLETTVVTTPSDLTTAAPTVEEQITQEIIDRTSTTIGTSTKLAFAEAYLAIENEIDTILRSIEIANSFNSDRDIDTFTNRINDLREQLATADDAATYRALVEEEFASMVALQRERIQSERAAVRAQLAENDSLDSDKDGVTDADEDNIFATDPLNPDTDGDGVLDGIEIMRGTNPLVADAQPTVFESPVDAGVTRSDILAVTSIQSVAETEVNTEEQSATDPSLLASSTSALIAGRAIPNSFVTLFIFSQPTVVTVRTAADGSWEYRFEKELPDGSHTVYAALTDHAGRVVAKSEPFEFIKQAEAFFAPGSVVTDQPQASETSLFSSYIFYMMMSLSVISLGLILMLIGFHIQSKRRSEEAFSTV